MRTAIRTRHGGKPDAARRPAGFLLALAAAAWLWPATAAAQTGDFRDVLNRLERLQRELGDLQRHVYRGEAPPAAAPPADSAAAKGVSIRLTQFGNEIRRLTGRIEELEHRLRGIGERVAAVEKGAAEALAAAEGPPPEPEAAAGGGEPAPGRPEGTLGVISGGEASPDGAAGGAQAAAAPRVPSDEPPGERYVRALDLLLDKGDYAAAEKALREFIELHPGHRLAANAYYWLGETHFVRGNYRDAALTFGKGFPIHSRSPKAPDLLYKLGVSLARLERRREACTAFETLAKRFPEAGVRLAGRIERERSLSKCR